MKIKHWQGYGCVNARKVKKATKNGTTTLVVEVIGDHEWGLVRDDMYDLKRWLVERFDKATKDIPYWRIDHNIVSEFVKGEDGHYTEKATYTFYYPCV